MTRLVVIVILCLGVLSAARQTHAQDITQLGGALSTTMPGHNAIQVAAPNVRDEQLRQRQLSGFFDFHSIRDRSQGLGPRFVNSSCGGCHIQNGRGPDRIGPGVSTMVVKVSVAGKTPDGAPRPVPGVGEQLQDHNLRGKTLYGLRLRWREIRGFYPDGRRYSLRAPILSFKLPDRSFRTVRSSLRMTPPLIGLGLLESIPESAILSFADPNDRDGDGIRGIPQYVRSTESGELELGRFGFRGSHTNVKEQSAAAAFFDMGLTNQYHPAADGSEELSREELARLTIYQQLPGVPMARRQSHPDVLRGKAIFSRINCSGCHRMSITTGGDAAYPELAEQQIHPFTDLLLHDMGPGLADRRAEFNASGRHWRTAPLWGLGFARTLSKVPQRYLHDGRARTIEEAILWHGGEAKRSREEFKQLPLSDRKALIKFLESL
jgi:CxxC motif-containing protein (DUF1111 family)